MSQHQAPHQAIEKTSIFSNALSKLFKKADPVDAPAISVAESASAARDHETDDDDITAQDVEEYVSNAMARNINSRFCGC